ncbi:lysophospholipid acyltransferase family protein [Riemerella columbina]|uniref:lysophospholipid acyltransferase family protein n=1 Tax=Riemerella columbina TaxID=103810 RepID=UPI000372C4CF|nr:lysophospholipid acyltransferase family protein [Riemerella columbina]
MVILVYLWRLWFVILGIVMTLLIGPWVYLFSFKPSHYKICYALIRLWAVILFYGIGFRCQYFKEVNEHIDPNRQYIFIANHTSIVDVFLMLVLLPNHPFCFVGKKELVKIPIFGTIYKRVVVMVDRSDAKSRSEVYARASERMQKGQSIVIFPEGLVPDDTSILLAPFKNGAFILAAEHQLPLCCFTFIGLRKMFPFNYSKGYPGRIPVYFNGIIEPKPEDTFLSLKDKAFSKIKNTLETHELSF